MLVWILVPGVWIVACTLTRGDGEVLVVMGRRIQQRVLQAKTCQEVRQAAETLSESGHGQSNTTRPPLHLPSRLVHQHQFPFHLRGAHPPAPTRLGLVSAHQNCGFRHGNKNISRCHQRHGDLDSHPQDLLDDASRGHPPRNMMLCASLRIGFRSGCDLSGPFADASSRIRSSRPVRYWPFVLATFFPTSDPCIASQSTTPTSSKSLDPVP